MRITKFTHSCLRIEYGGRTVVIDPGGFSEAEALDGADAVLITHEHPDHVDFAKLAGSDVPIHTIDAVARLARTEAPDVAERIHVVTPGQQLEVAGIPVSVEGELHAVIHPELPRFDNSGYVLTLDDVRVYHPGDALTPPTEPVDVLLAPVCAPWMAIADGIDFARRVGAPRNVAIHEAIYSEAGLGLADGHFGRFLAAGEQDYVRLQPGQDMPI